MKKLTKCAASLFMALVLTLTMMPVLGQVAYAESEADVIKDGFGIHLWYSDAGASAGVRKYTGSATQVILPTSVSYGGKTYDAASGTADFFLQSSTFAGNTTITKIAIPNGYYNIEEGAFDGCKSLTEVAIGDSLEYLTNGAFTGCPATTYYFKGENVSSNSIATSGIGTDSSGDPIAGVVVYTKAGSNTDTGIQELNKTRPDDKKITLKYVDDPYSQNTVKPDSGSDSGSGSGSGGGSVPKPVNGETKGEDGTNIGKGASESLADRTIQAYASEKDPKGSVFNLLQAKLSKGTKSSLTLSWKKVPGAKKYVIYGNACGTKNKLLKQTSKTGTSFKITKVNKKKLKKGTYYKFVIMAVNAKGKVISTSKIVHACTKGGKNGNDKKVTTKAKKNKATVKKGKSFKLAGKPVPVSKTLKVRRHRGINYESSNKKIATVNSKGVIKGKKKGTCYVYAYAQNGVFAKIKVTVK